MPYIGLILAILIILFQGTLRQYTSNLVGSWLIGALKTSTQGNYTLDYDFVRFDIFTKELRIQDLNLKLDSTVIQEEEYLEKYSNLVDLSTPVVVLKLESLWDLIVNDKLRIAYIGMKEPSVNLIQSRNLTEEQNKENQQQTAETIRSYLNEVEIDSFRIINGSLNINLQNALGEEVVGLRVGNFSTLLRGFQLNEINPDKLFQGIYVNEVELEVLDQEIILPQFYHKLSFERLWISSLDSIIELDTLRLLPTLDSGASLTGNLYLKRIALESIDFKKAYDEYILDIGQFEVNNADLSLLRKFASTTSNNSKIDISKLPFKSYLIRNVNITDSKLNLGLDRKLKIENFDFNLSNYKLDTANLTLEKIASGIDDFELDMLNSRFELPDSIHEVKIGLIHVDSKASKARLSNVVLNPISDRRKYQLYKQQGTNLINYASVRQVILEGVNFDQLLDNQQLLVDSLYIISPTANITEYPYIKPKKNNGNDFAYLINKVKVSNGSIKYNKRQNNRNNRSEANGINLEISGFFPEQSKPTFDNLIVQIADGYSEINPINHIVRFKDLSSKDLRRLDIGVLELDPDSTNKSNNEYRLRSTGLSLIAYNRDFLSNTRQIKLEELSAQSLNLDVKIGNKTSDSKPKIDIDNLILNRFYFNNGSFTYEDSLNKVSFERISTFVDSLKYDFKDSTSGIPASFNDLMISHAAFELELKNHKIHISGDLGKYSENDSLISFSELEYKTDNKITTTIKNFQINGLNRHKLLANNGLEFENLIIDGHKLSFVIDSTANKSDPIELNNSVIKNVLLSTFTEIMFDSLSYRGGEIQFISQNRITSLENCNLTIRDYVLDTTTTLASLFRPETLNFNISTVRSQSAKDTIVVSGVSLDILNKTLFTGNIAIAFHDLATNWQVDIPGVIASGFELSKIIEQDYSLDTILINNAKISLYTKDSSNNSVNIKRQRLEISEGLKSIFSKNKTLSYDTLFTSGITSLGLKNIALDSNKNLNFKKLMGKLRINKEEPETEQPLPIPISKDSLVQVTMNRKALPTNGLIRYIGLNDAVFRWQVNNVEHDILSDLNLSVGIQGLVLDSLNQVNIYNHFEDLRIVVKDYALDLPDSLNNVSFKQLVFSTKKETIEIEDIALTPLVNKYDYANKVGHQAGWHDLKGLDLVISKLDLHKLLNQRIVDAKSVRTSNGVLDIFKDKELPIPVNQYRPMLQDAIKRVRAPIHVDSIFVDNFHVDFTSRLSSDLPEGSLSFHEINAKVANVTNIDTLIYDKPILHIDASTKIMGKGLLTANFDFNMDDPDNKFDFFAHLRPMSAREFNSLLEATAYVSVESGDIKDLTLRATGDNIYALGSMKFEYSNLKVSTINKKNLKTTGMGKVIKSFFANAFVVKKNNPAFKIFPRQGDMFYERDPQKIIIDYVAKTALSGIISSIGARNFRKEIKNIQNETKKQIEEDRKELKKANKDNPSLP